MSRKKKPSGRDPLFERGKNRENYQRRGNLLSPKKTILIVCEGKQTEPNYFNALRSTLRRKNIRVLIIPGGENLVTPIYLVQNMEAERQKLDWDPTNDEAWCVFDIEQVGTHHSLDQALGFARKHNFQLALSNPAFEYWLLLHFERTGRAFTNATEVINSLSHHIPNYSKSMAVYRIVREQTEQAIDNAESLRSLHEGRWEDFPNPSTGVDLLVKKLTKSREPERNNNVQN
jgi:hypothetical protein